MKSFKYYFCLLALIALAGCDGKPSTAVQNGNTGSNESSSVPKAAAPAAPTAPKATAVKITDACNLLTEQEVSAAFGDAKVGAPTKVDNPPTLLCIWFIKNTTRRSVAVTVQPKSGLIDGRNCKRLDGLGTDACAESNPKDNNMWGMVAVIGGDQELAIEFHDETRDVAATKDSAMSLLKAVLGRLK